MQTCCVRPDSLVRVDNNHYSVPSRWVGQWVTVKAYPFRVEVWAQGEKVAQHRPSFEAGRTLYDSSHYIGWSANRGRPARPSPYGKPWPPAFKLYARTWPRGQHLPYGLPL